MTSARLIGGPLDGIVLDLLRTPPYIEGMGFVYRRLDDPVTGEFLGGYTLDPPQPEGERVKNEIRRMPRPEFEKPKRRVPYRLYFVCTMIVGLLWLWFEDDEHIHWSTFVIVVFGLMTMGKGIARFILNERAIGRSLRTLKGPYSER